MTDPIPTQDTERNIANAEHRMTCMHAVRTSAMDVQRADEEEMEMDAERFDGLS